MFKIGDEVRCIDKRDSTYLVVGGIYTVLSACESSVQVDVEGASKNWYVAGLFELLVPSPKYKTKPISYKGCHPVIEEHLRRGEAIFCRTHGTEDMEWVIAYTADNEFPYQVLDNSHRFATPVAFKKKLKSLKECLNLLIDNGWEMDEWGFWTKVGKPALLPALLLNWNKDAVYPDFLFEEVWK